MKNIDDFFNCSILDELCEARREEFSSKVTTNSKEYQGLIDDTEKRMKELLNYVPKEYHKELEEKIEDFLFENVLEMSEFWNVNFYKLGFMDGLNAKKEIEKQMEVYDNEESLR